MAVIERLSANDLMTLATDHGQVPMNIAALLILGPGASESVVAQVAARLAGVPRLRQRLQRAGLAGGRPYWRIDPDFDPANHVVPLGDGDLLDEVARLVCRRLPRDRPLWRMGWRELPDGTTAVAIVLHHVVADGLGGLALLSGLMDGAPAVRTTPVSAPRPGDLRRDAARSAWRAVRGVGTTLRHAVRGLRELGGARPRAVGPSSITLPTSGRRRVATVTVPLQGVRDAAGSFGVSVNDVLVASVGGALFDLLDRRGERPPEVVVSVPISARADSDGGLGNKVGAVPVAVPLRESARLATIARRTRAAKAGSRGSSALVLGWVFRGLAAIGAGQRFIDHQRMVHTFETNMRGPERGIRIAGRDVLRIVPVAVNPGNVGVSFDALSYAGELLVSVVVDPEQVPDPRQVADDLRRHLVDLGAA